MALLAVPILTACGRVPYGPATLLPVPRAGSWVGQTSQGTPLSFDASNGLVTKFSLEYIYPGPACAISKASIRVSEIETSVGEIVVGQGGGRIDGSFTTNTTASGTARLVPPAKDRPACEIANITWHAHWAGH